jgi:sec-independent protein translocase protein TatB
MFEIGWTEILFVAIVAIFVLKPKDYPDALRSIGNFLTRARQMAGEFQSQFNDAMRDANLDDVRKTIDEIRDLKNMGPLNQVRESLTQFADETTSVKKSIESGVTPPPSALAPDPYVGPMADPYTGTPAVDPYTGQPTTTAISAIPTPPEPPAGLPTELMPPQPAPPASDASQTAATAPAAHGPERAA